MTTENQESREQLHLSERYNAAIQLHNQEFRTLGERNNAFLITQSILVAAFVYIVTSQNLVAPEFIAWGIILAGIWLCCFYCQAGRSGSQAAFRWRQYMRRMENKQPLTPWNWVYDDSKHKHGQETRRNLLRRLTCERCLLERSPLPIAWLISTAIFLAVWGGATCYIHVIGDFSLCLYHIVTLWISLGIVGSFIINKSIVWWRQKSRT